jgi:hypothetical protein
METNNYLGVPAPIGTQSPSGTVFVPSQSHGGSNRISPGLRGQEPGSLLLLDLAHSSRPSVHSRSPIQYCSPCVGRALPALNIPHLITAGLWGLKDANSSHTGSSYSSFMLTGQQQGFSLIPNSVTAVHLMGQVLSCSATFSPPTH